MYRLGLALVGCFISVVSWGCEGDGDTLLDEVEANPEYFDILIGQFDKHGSAYYWFRIDILSEKSNLSREERLELATAYMHVREYEYSEEILKALVQEDPGYFPALEIRGELAQRQGELELAIGYIKRALELNPEGYLDTGEWYLEKLERERFPEECQYGKVDFVDGWDAYNLISLDEYIKRMFALIKNDQTFAEGFYLLGKALESRQDCHLAELAIVRAKMLSDAYLVPGGVWYTAKYDYDFGDKDISMTEKILREAEKWRALYVQQEKMLAAQGIEPTFSKMKSETPVYEMKNQLSVKSTDGYLVIGIFVAAVITAFAYWRKKVEKEEEARLRR